MFFFMILSGSLKSEPGQLIDYTHQSTMTQDDINLFYGLQDLILLRIMAFRSMIYTMSPIVNMAQ